MRLIVTAFAIVLLAALIGVVPVVLCAVAALLFAPAPARIVRLALAVSDEQPVALRALVSFRAPPRAAFA